jgi:hypothetical protein
MSPAAPDAAFDAGHDAGQDPALDAAARRRDAVLRAFLEDDGHLRSIPARRSKRLVVLDLLAQVFDVGRRYPEREVNALLRAFHDDVAALRRYLIDEGFLSREAGEYWRTGGTVLVDDDPPAGDDADLDEGTARR